MLSIACLILKLTHTESWIDLMRLFCSTQMNLNCRPPTDVASEIYIAVTICFRTFTRTHNAVENKWTLHWPTHRWRHSDISQNSNKLIFIFLFFSWELTTAIIEKRYFENLLSEAIERIWIWRLWPNQQCHPQSTICQIVMDLWSWKRNPWHPFRSFTTIATYS